MQKPKKKLHCFGPQNVINATQLKTLHMRKAMPSFCAKLSNIKKGFKKYFTTCMNLYKILEIVQKNWKSGFSVFGVFVFSGFLFFL